MSKYYLNGNGLDTWEISLLHGRCQATVIKTFIVPDSDKEKINSETDETKKTSKKNRYYLYQKYLAEQYLEELNKS